MGRPKGSKNVKREGKLYDQPVVNLDDTENHPQGFVALATEPKPHTDEVSGAELAPDLVLTVRQIHVGSFHGLWELCRIEPDGTKVVISDANTKAMICNLARNEIIRCRQ